jgi:hypothetical protein
LRITPGKESIPAIERGVLTEKKEVEKRDVSGYIERGFY